MRAPEAALCKASNNVLRLFRITARIFRKCTLHFPRKVICVAVASMERQPSELEKLLASLRRENEPADGRTPNPQVPVLDLSYEDISRQKPPSETENGTEHMNDTKETNDSNATAKKLFDLLSRGLSSKADGSPSPTKGPCKCGYKHWLEGKEYDYVFQIETTKGGLILGFNANGFFSFFILPSFLLSFFTWAGGGVELLQFPFLMNIYIHQITHILLLLILLLNIVLMSALSTTPG